MRTGSEEETELTVVKMHGRLLVGATTVGPANLDRGEEAEEELRM